MSAKSPSSSEMPRGVPGLTLDSSDSDSSGEEEADFEELLKDEAQVAMEVDGVDEVPASVVPDVEEKVKGFFEESADEGEEEKESEDKDEENSQEEGFVDTTAPRNASEEQQRMKSFNEAAKAKNFGTYEVDSSTGYANKGLGGAPEYNPKGKRKHAGKSWRGFQRAAKKENTKRRQDIEKFYDEAFQVKEDVFGLSLVFTEGDKIKRKGLGPKANYTIVYDDNGETKTEEWPVVTVIENNDTPRFSFEMTFKPIVDAFINEMKRSYKESKPEFQNSEKTVFPFPITGTKKQKERKFKRAIKVFRNLTGTVEEDMSSFTYDNYLKFMNMQQKSSSAAIRTRFFESSKNYLVRSTKSFEDIFVTQLERLRFSNQLSSHQQNMLLKFIERVKVAAENIIKRINQEYTNVRLSLPSRELPDSEEENDDILSEIEDDDITRYSEAELEDADSDADSDNDMSFAVSSMKRRRTKFAEANSKATAKPSTNLVKKKQIQLRF